MSLRCQFISKSSPHNISQGKRKLSWIRRVLMCSVLIYNHPKSQLCMWETKCLVLKQRRVELVSHLEMHPWIAGKILKNKTKLCLRCSLDFMPSHRAGLDVFAPQSRARAEQRASRCDLPSSSFLTSLEAKNVHPIFLTCSDCSGFSCARCGFETVTVSSQPLFLFNHTNWSNVHHSRGFLSPQMCFGSWKTVLIWSLTMHILPYGHIVWSVNLLTVCRCLNGYSGNNQHDGGDWTCIFSVISWIYWPSFQMF